MDRLLTAEEVADQVGGDVRAWTVTRARREGRLAGRKPSRRWLYHPDDVEAWVTSLRRESITAKPAIGTARSAARRSRGVS